MKPDPRSMLAAVEVGNVVWWPVAGPNGEFRWQYRTPGPLSGNESRVLDQLNLAGLIEVRERYPNQHYYSRRLVRLTEKGKQAIKLQPVKVVAA